MPTHFDTGGTRGLYSYGDINAVDGVAALSWCVWHYQTAAENTATNDGVSVGIWGKDNQAASPIYLFKNNGGGVNPKLFGCTDGSVGNVFSNNNVILDTTWQHLGITFDGSQGAGSRGALYLNGASTTVAHDAIGTTIPANASSILLGSIGGSVPGWAGTLAFAKMWTAVLTPSEMLLECLHAEPQRTDNLVLYIPLAFDGNGAGTTYDGTNALSSTTNTPTSGIVSDPPVLYPAGATIGHRNNWRRTGALRRNRFQRLGPKRPLVQYG